MKTVEQLEKEHLAIIEGCWGSYLHTSQQSAELTFNECIQAQIDVLKEMIEIFDGMSGHDFYYKGKCEDKIEELEKQKIA